MKKQEIVKKKDNELDSLLVSLKKELFNLKSASIAGEDSQKKKARIKTVKRDIARIKTRLNS
ncbi:MAG: 50S ribosomal protein L29 [Nanoarchaeota archaeon]